MGGGEQGGDPLAYFDHIAFNAGPCFAVPYAEDWEVGVRGWTDLGGQPPTLASDATSPYGHSVQQIDRATAGGDYFSPPLDVTGGQTYCVRAAINWLSGAAPFVGIERLVGGTSQGVNCSSGRRSRTSWDRPRW